MFAPNGKPQNQNAIRKPKGKGIYYMLDYLHNHIMAMNQSKIFAGIMIVVLNIASKFMTFRMSKTMEAYLRYSFSRDVLVFAITWMGTRDIYTALALTAVFVILVDFLFNEESSLCILPESFIDHHASISGTPVTVSDAMTSKLLSPDDKVKLQQLLDKAGGNADKTDKSTEGMETKTTTEPPTKLDDSGAVAIPKDAEPKSSTELVQDASALLKNTNLFGYSM
jgi:hypothetical protein